MIKTFKPKFFSLLKQGFTKEQVFKDVMAGIVVGIVALPLAIAFAVASGVSPEKGIITAIIAGFIISILGGSRVQIGGPTGAFIIIIFGIVQQYGLNGLIISTILAGIFLVLLGVMRLGTLLKFIPYPLIVGFTSGIAIVIFSTQIRDALGLDIETIPADFIAKWTLYINSISTINYSSLAICLITIGIVYAFSRSRSRIPGSFYAIIGITFLVYLFDIQVPTIETFFGEIKTSFNITFPSIKWTELQLYIMPAITIAILGGLESLLSAVVADGMIGGRHRSNTELIAQGIANIVTPFFGGVPATGAIARTATNIKNGGRTPIAGIVHSITLLLIMLFFGAWAKLIPMACLAGILIVVAYNMSEWRTFISITKSNSADVLVLLVTFFLTILVDLTVAIQTGIVLAALLFMKRMADNTALMTTDVDSDVIEDYSKLSKGIGIFEISGPMFFGSAKEYVEIIEKVGLKNKILIIRMRHVPFIDITGIRNLKSVIKLLQSKDIEIILSGVNKEVFRDLFKNGIIDLIHRKNICDSFEKAVKHAENIMAKES